MSLLRAITRIGRIAEPAPPRTDSSALIASSLAVESDADRDRSVLRTGSVQIRHVDAGSCNGCEVEIASAFGPVYDAGRYGLRLVASPRHADVLLVTGPVTHNMVDPLRKAYEAMPAPKWVVALGDCARDCGIFAGGYGVFGAVRDVLPVDVEVPGCPPTPEAIIATLRGLTGR